jgi:hypothetical protein
MVSQRKNYRTTFALTSDPVDISRLNGGVQVSEDLLCLVDQNQGIKSETFKRKPKKQEHLPVMHPFSFYLVK